MTLIVSAMLFDLDGVLADSTASVVRAWTTWAHRVGLDPASVVSQVHGRRAVDTIRAVGPELDADEELEFLLGLETQNNEDVYPIPGAPELLAALPADAWAVVTSGLRPVATARLVAAGIPLPRIMISAESVERGKPDPQGYLLGAAALGVSPEQCVVVEDAPAGAAAARNAGMRLLALTTTHGAADLQPADLVVPDLSHVIVSVIERTGDWAPHQGRLEIRVDR